MWNYIFLFVQDCLIKNKSFQLKANSAYFEVNLYFTFASKKVFANQWCCNSVTYGKTQFAESEILQQYYNLDYFHTFLFSRAGPKYTKKIIFMLTNSGFSLSNST
jgi:hypothetical protein